jgi:hypothetical protein
MSLGSRFQFTLEFFHLLCRGSKRRPISGGSLIRALNSRNAG